MPNPFVNMKWGTADHLTKALFNQREVWITAKSEVRKINEMAPSHVLNTLLMIERMDDLPIENLHATPLYEALYDRVLSFLPPREQFEHRIGAQTGRISCAKPNISTGAIDNGRGPLWPHPSAAWRELHKTLSGSASPATTSRRIAVDRAGIRDILETAIDAREDTPTGKLWPRVLIDYEDADGVETTLREIIPEKIEPRRVGHGFSEDYLKAYDTGKSEPRVFKLERIKRCEAV